MSNRRFKEKVGLLFHIVKRSSRKDAVKYIKKTAPLTRHVGKRNRTRAPTLERTHRVFSKTTAQTWYQRTDTISDSWKAHHSKKETKIWSLMKRRIRDDKSAVTTARVLHIFNGKNLCTSELCNVTQARMCTCHRHIGFSWHEDPIKFRRLVPWGFRISKGRKAVYFSVVSPLDPNPDPKYKPYLHMKNHHERLFVMDLEAQNSLGFYQTANGTVLCYDTVPSEFTTKIINLKDGSERFRKEEFQEEQVSPKKKSRCDHGQPRETSWHNTKQETIEPRQLRAISSTAEIIKENRSSEVYAQCTCCSKRSRWWTDFCRCGKKLGGWTAVQEKNAQVADENGCQFIQSLIQLRIAEQVQRSQRHGTSKDQIYWTLIDARPFPKMHKIADPVTKQ